ncbi:MAG: hypothetical protein WCV73_03745 [Patescibacteria group bacterium]
MSVKFQLNNEPSVSGKLTAAFTVENSATLKVSVVSQTTVRGYLEYTFNCGGYLCSDRIDMPARKRYNETFKITVV